MSIQNIRLTTAVVGLLISALPVLQTHAQDGLGSPPDLAALVDFNRGQSDFRVAVIRYDEDRDALLRRYDIPLSPLRRDRLEEFYLGWLDQLAAVAFDDLNREGQIDYILLRNEIEFQQEMLRQEAEAVREMEPLVPFHRELEQLQESRRDRDNVQARETADLLDRVASDAEALTSRIRGGGAGLPDMSSVAATRAASHVESLSRMLSGWFRYYQGYDPLFTWWVPKPYERLQGALEAHALAIRDHWIGDAADGPVVGDPIGEEGLRAHLIHEMIPYSAQELIAIAEAEFAWMEEALIEASREMGYGDDWKAAQEAVKNLAVDPGQKPGVVRDLERQSVEFVEARDWITLPPLAHEVWRMEMLSPERQRVSPFFLGGETIQISYPTDEMTHQEKLMSMRGNNPHFNRATVHHELIPGHHLQGFMTERFNDHRGMFGTPFWTEGWALYWEMVLWDAGFPRGPEDEIGMLFWRMHRAARIIFSLSFHLERMTPQEAVDFLVDRVGHERANAEAEVRRSFAGSYPPLYQVAYMMGGIQFRALYRDLVDSGQMTPREFHDAVLKGGSMPVEMVRARLTDIALTPDYTTQWMFEDEGAAPEGPAANISGCEGPPYPELSESEYVLPFAPGQTFETGLTNCSESFHGAGYPDQYAFDFNMPIGTAFTAAKAGVVYRIVEDAASDGGDGVGNYMVVDHEDGTFGLYYHSPQNGIDVEVGDRVEQGDVLGRTGQSGYAGYPHLHFIVVKDSPDYPYEGLPVSFRNVVPGHRSLRSNTEYSSIDY